MSENLIELTATIVSAFVENNKIGAAELPQLIKSVWSSLSGVDEPAPAPPAAVDMLTPGQIRRSITHDHLISFMDGKKYKSLKRHLAGHGLTPAEYRERFALPRDYPMTSPSYSAARSVLAKAAGLGQGGRAAVKSEVTPTVSTKAAAKARGRSPKAIEPASDTFT